MAELSNYRTVSELIAKGTMDNNTVPDFRRYFEEWSQDLEVLRQNKLLGES
jgi:hypothetical protein